jgi:hypothetical protein
MGITNSTAMKGIVDLLTKTLELVNRLTDGTLGFATALNRIVTIIGMLKVAKGAFAAIATVVAAKTAPAKDGVAPPSNKELGAKAKEAFINNTMPKRFVNERNARLQEEALSETAEGETSPKGFKNTITGGATAIKEAVGELKSPELLKAPATTAGVIIGEEIVKAAK